MSNRPSVDNTIKDIYKEYKSIVNDKDAVDSSTFSKVLSEFNLRLVNKVLNESETVKFPFRLGHIRIKKVKMNYSQLHKLKPDWEKTNKLWESNPKAKEEKKLIYHLNEERRGYMYRVYWDKKGCNIKGHKVYKFTPTRTFKRTLAKILKNNLEIDYYQ